LTSSDFLRRGVSSSNASINSVMMEDERMVDPGEGEVVLGKGRRQENRETGKRYLTSPAC